MRERDLTILLIGLALGSIISYLVHAGYKELTGSEVSWQIDILITSILALV